ncbi:MAG TPA: uroporphyrinogen-III C-methyltransferase [Terriglobales bacterium]
MKGTVYLVGAGPGDPELLTVKALRLLRVADVVLHDDLVTPEILRLIPLTAQVLNVGKRCGRKQIRQHEINLMMITLAHAGLHVLRLKGGDPLIFGRAGEEMDALRRANVSYEIVPGITAALGAAAAAQISLTHRGLSSAVIFLTAQHASGHEGSDWSRLSTDGVTLVIYMLGNHYGEIAQRLATAGIAPATACIIVSRAASPHQQSYRTVLRDLHTVKPLPAPSLIIVGEVARLSQSLGSWSGTSIAPPLPVSPATSGHPAVFLEEHLPSQSVPVQENQERIA